MSANPHSLVHAREYPGDKCKEESNSSSNGRKSEPGVKGVVSVLLLCCLGVFSGKGSYRRFPPVRAVRSRKTVATTAPLLKQTAGLEICSSSKCAFRGHRLFADAPALLSNRFWLFSWSLSSLTLLCFSSLVFLDGCHWKAFPKDAPPSNGNWQLGAV